MTRLRGLPVQLFLFTILPLTLLLAAIAFGGLTLHQRAMRQMVGERDERATRAAAGAIEEQLQRRAAAVTNLGLHLSHVSAEDALAASIPFRQDFVGLAIIGSDGSILATDEPDIWARVIDGSHLPSPGTTTLFTDPENGEAVGLVTAPTRDGGMAAGAFDPAAIARDVLARVVRPGDHSVAYLVAPDGTLLYQTGPGDHSEPITDHPGVAEALRGEIGTSFLNTSGVIGGEDHVVTYTPVAPVGWALVMEEAWQEMTDPMLRRTELAPFVLLPALAIALAGLWFGARQIVRPLQTLAERTTTLGRGEFDAVREPVGGIGEIRQLQGELVGMARRLQMAQQGLRDYLGALTAGQEEERHRLARELHDDTIQSLIALNQRIQLAQTRATGEAAAQLAEMGMMTTATIADLRRLTRDLRPSYLDDLGLVPALELLARDQSAALKLPVFFETSGEIRRPAPETELAFYRIAQEALRNVGRHASANRALISLDFSPEAITLTIRDDGTGFDPAERAAELALGGHFGLLGARERAEAVGARLEVESAPGKGTAIRVTSASAPALTPNP
jgi:signal transduction histidine kinase